MRSVPVAVLVLLAASRLGAQEAPQLAGLPLGTHAVGYRMDPVVDSARTYGGSSVRPLHVHVWYPALPGTGRPESFAAYTRDWGTDMAGAVDPEARRARIESEFRVGLHRSRLRLNGGRSGPNDPPIEDSVYTRIMQTPVLAASGATQLPGSPPIVMVASMGFSGPAGVNVIGELLASRGFVVIALPFLSVNPDLSWRPEWDASQLTAEVADLELILNWVRQRYPGSAAGVLALHSVSPLVLQSRTNPFAAMVLLDEMPWTGMLAGTSIDPQGVSGSILNVPIGAAPPNAHLFESLAGASVFAVTVRGADHGFFSQAVRVLAPPSEADALFRDAMNVIALYFDACLARTASGRCDHPGTWGRLPSTVSISRMVSAGN